MNQFPRFCETQILNSTGDHRSDALRISREVLRSLYRFLERILDSIHRLSVL
ncbi:hypothetical protein LEP1GSC059_3992 [Leptospira noguchii serovar Panama str. CZ214]|uniref:Uncharacterized protein n=1 Tax=Leptospira noguchii serovar Panama str. CZ214 TaxID=1001595 RepID=T0FU79_9LEPT|nr:hypothetical protein LEP1GSC059_3992 [Leptospira noguchii serovar Panama str. CZ214]